MDKMNRINTPVKLTLPNEGGERSTMGHYYRCPSPLLGETHNLNMLSPPRKRASSFKKPNEKNIDIFLNDDIRPRTCSMPSRSSFRRPQHQELQRALLRLNIESDTETYTVRSFQINSKGVIIKRTDSMRSRSTNSIVSSEGDLCPLSPVSRTSSSVSRESVGTSPCSTAASSMFPYRIMVVGAPSVGKTALTQQFMTSEYLGGFDTSADGETERTVNVLLDGEETSLAFVEQAELHEEDTADSIAAYVIVYACDDRASFDRTVDILYNLRQKQHQEHVIFFVGNKADLVRSRCVPAEEAKAVAMTYGCKFVETSVVLNVKVDELLVGIVKQLRLRSAESGAEKSSTSCSSSSKSLLNKLFKKDNLSKSCENLYA